MKGSDLKMQHIPGNIFDRISREECQGSYRKIKKFRVTVSRETDTTQKLQQLAGIYIPFPAGPKPPPPINHLRRCKDRQTGISPFQVDKIIDRRKIKWTLE